MPIIETVDQLEAVVGKKPAALDMKVVDHIDPHAQRWLAHSAFMMATLGLSDGPIMVMAGGEPGFTAATANPQAVPQH